MNTNHKKRAEMSIKTSKFMTLHVEHPVLARNRIISGTFLKDIEIIIIHHYHILTN